jgi:hypothetical protein
MPDLADDHRAAPIQDDQALAGRALARDLENS